MKPIILVKECSNFEQGNGSVYKAKPRRIQVPEKIVKAKVKEVKPKPAPKIIKKEIKSPQKRLF